MSDREKLTQWFEMRDKAPFAFDPRRAAMIVVDVQRNFTRPDCPFGLLLERLVPGVSSYYFARVRDTVLPNLQRLLAGFRDIGAPLIFTGTGSCTPDAREFPPFLREIDMVSRQVLGRGVWPPPDDPAWQIDEAIAPQPGELVVNKTSTSALNGTPVEQTLRQMGAETVFVTGLVTEACVASTARAVADRGFQLVVVEDAVASLTPEMEQATMDQFRIGFGRVWTTDRVLEALCTTRQAGAVA